MNVEIGTEAAQFPEKENINGIFVAVSTIHTSIPKVLLKVPKCEILMSWISMIFLSWSLYR